MATEVKLPRLGQGMESGTIVRWLKEEGDRVSKREPLYELDTDKVTQEVEAEADGVLLKILVREGEVEVGRTIAVIGREGEEVSLEAVSAPARADEGAAESGERPAEAPVGEPEREAGRRAAAEAAAAVPPSGSEPQGGDGRVKASPLARRMARERGIDLASVTGTGPDGRIVAEDVEKAAAAPVAPVAPAAPAPAGEVEVEVVRLTSTRKTIARRLMEAWQAPVFQLGVSADMTEVLALREKLVERLTEGDAKPTVNDVLTRLVAVALVRHPAVNATFTGEEIRRWPAAHVGIAVAAPNGLVVPVIRDADRRTIQEIARARADLVERARAGKLTLQDLEGGTFTISNLGMFGVEQFVAVLNPPQVAILAVGAVKETPVVVEGEIEVAPLVQLVLTCDHRAIDGADGAQFLQTLVALIEQPALAL
ncbi:MAG TPA: dihydrolipoamide acetyltransferase family protein [Gaiellaceae bacterium]|nr:dihydrolipoamide acetyltransferase family protein [Gaiellaceae bacterium]